MLLAQLYSLTFIRIYKQRTYWIVREINEYGSQKETRFLFPDGAFKLKDSLLEKAKYRIKARDMLMGNNINFRTLTDKETTFINKLIKNNCWGVSKKMYGYLKGIQERNTL